VIAAAAQRAAQRTEPPPREAAALPWRPADLLARVRQAVMLAPRAVQAALDQDARCSRASAADLAAETKGSGTRPLVLAKVVAEAAMLMRCAAPLRHADAALADAIDTLVHCVAPLACGEAVVVGLCRDPVNAIEQAAAHVYLSELGRRDERFDRFLQDVLDGEPALGAERAPNHLLEHEWLAQIRSGNVGRVPADGALLARTCVAWPLDALASSTLDLYAFTHVVLYASDMGRRTVVWPRPIDEIADDAQAALAAALDADNFDLAAELLWTWPMLGLRWSPAANFAFHVLAAAQDERGFLPGPEYMQRELQALSDEAHDELMLRTSYHATFVMGMLCAVALQPGRAPLQRMDEAADDAEPIDGLLHLLAPSSRAPRWLATQASLAPACRSALAPLVLSIVLRRAAAAHDIARVRSALEAALHGGWADGPSVQQAVALLRRATALARWQEGA
jgi:hypothetical protein